MVAQLRFARTTELAAGAKRPFRNWLSGVQLIEQSLGLFQIGRVETLGEPAIDWRQKLACFDPPALSAPQPREARRGTQLIGLCLFLRATRIAFARARWPSSSMLRPDSAIPSKRRSSASHGGDPYSPRYSAHLSPPQEPRHVHLGVSGRRPTWRGHKEQRTRIALARQAPHVNKRRPHRTLPAPSGRHRAGPRFHHELSRCSAASASATSSRCSASSVSPRSR